MSGTFAFAFGFRRKRRGRRWGRTWLSGTIASGCGRKRRGRFRGRTRLSGTLGFGRKLDRAFFFGIDDLSRVGFCFVDDVCKSWFLGRSYGLVHGSGFFRFENSSILGSFCFICCGTLVISGNYLATDILHSANNSIFGFCCASHGHLCTSFCSSFGHLCSETGFISNSAGNGF